MPDYITKYQKALEAAIAKEQRARTSDSQRIRQLETELEILLQERRDQRRKIEDCTSRIKRLESELEAKSKEDDEQITFLLRKMREVLERLGMIPPNHPPDGPNIVNLAKRRKPKR